MLAPLLPAIILDSSSALNCDKQCLPLSFSLSTIMLLGDGNSI